MATKPPTRWGIFVPQILGWAYMEIFTTNEWILDGDFTIETSWMDHSFLPKGWDLIVRNASLSLNTIGFEQSKNDVYNMYSVRVYDMETYPYILRGFNNHKRDLNYCSDFMDLGTAPQGFSSGNMRCYIKCQIWRTSVYIYNNNSLT